MTPRTRYQGAIIRDHHILLLKQIEHASGRAIGRSRAAASSRVRPRNSACGVSC
jgi:hypothetical protein